MFSSFKDVIKNYKVIFFDASGVLKKEGHLFKNTPEVLSYILNLDKKVRIISNDASKTPEAISSIYVDSLGEKLISPDDIITSGMVASKYLSDNFKGAKIPYLGPPTSEYYIKSAGCIPIHLDNIDDFHDINAFIFMDNDGFDWKKSLNKLINLINQQPALTLLAPNPDLSFPSKGGISLASGALAKMLEIVLKRKFIFFGKPHQEMFNYAIKSTQIKDLNIKDILMVGDTIETDILGSSYLNMDSLLVFSGNTTTKNYDELCSLFKCKPTYLSESIFT